MKQYKEKSLFSQNLKLIMLEEQKLYLTLFYVYIWKKAILKEGGVYTERGRSLY